MAGIGGWGGGRGGYGICYPIQETVIVIKQTGKNVAMYHEKSPWSFTELVAFLTNIRWRILNTLWVQGWSHLLIGWCHWTPYWQSCLCCILSVLALALSPFLALLLFTFQKERRDKLWNPYNQACIAETARRLDQWDAEHPSPSAVGLIFEFLSLAIAS